MRRKWISFLFGDGIDAEKTVLFRIHFPLITSFRWDSYELPWIVVLSIPLSFLSWPQLIIYSTNSNYSLFPSFFSSSNLDWSTRTLVSWMYKHGWTTTVNVTEDPALCAVFLTIISVILIVVSLPFSLFFCVKVRKNKDNKNTNRWMYWHVFFVHLLIIYLSSGCPRVWKGRHL